jgi:hypothetical protein
MHFALFYLREQDYSNYFLWKWIPVMAKHLLTNGIRSIEITENPSLYYEVKEHYPR